MNQSPDLSLLQKMSSRQVSGDHLEMLGREAASKYASGKVRDLSSAVVEVVKTAHLSAEQVRRVIEVTNTQAFQTDFKKESTQRFVHFPGGPADAGKVFAAINVTEKTASSDGLHDYGRAPRSKTAELVDADRILAEAFKTDGRPDYPELNPMGDAYRLRDKLASASEHLTSEISRAELDYMHAVDSLFGSIKEAAHVEGTSLGDVIRAWQAIGAKSEFVKAAFSALTPRLMKEQVFDSLDAMGASLQKTSAERFVNQQHPLVTGFEKFAFSLAEIAHMREAREEVDVNLDQLSDFLCKSAADKNYAIRMADALEKSAKPGVLRQGWDAARGATTRAADLVAPHVAEGAAHLLGGTHDAGIPQLAGQLTSLGIKGLPLAAAGLGATALYDQAEAASERPIVRAIAEHTPLTDAHEMRQRRRIMEAQGFLGGGGFSGGGGSSGIY